MNSKHFAVVLLILMLAGILSACAGNPGTAPAVVETAPAAAETAPAAAETTPAAAETAPAAAETTPAAAETAPAAADAQEKVTISIGIRSFPAQAPPAAELWQWKKYEEMNNVHVEWMEVASDTIAEKKGVMMAAGDYPDAFYGQMGFSNAEVAKYGADGIFIPLNDLIDKHGPNLTKMFNEHPDWKAAMTAPDGNIYSLPWIDEAILPSSLRYYVNKKWLDNLGLEMPETLDEYASVMKAFRDQDANGNGDPNDEIPFSLPNGGGFVGLWENAMAGAFGMGNGGLPALQQLLYIDADGQLQTTINDPKMKELWSYMHMFSAEKLMPDTIFSGIEYAQWVNEGKEDKIGAFTFVHPYYLSSGPEAENFAGINMLTGPNGDQVMSYVDHPIRGTASFMITDKNQHPERTMEWIDYAYGDEGRMFFKFGTEGETYTLVDGKPRFINEIIEAEKGDGLGVFQWIYNWYGGYVPGWEVDQSLVANAIAKEGAPVQDQYKVTAEDAERWKPKQFLPRFFPTAEESTRTSAILTDVNKYLSESRAKFVLGEWDLNGADWDNYVKTLESMGLGEYLDITRKQYERFVQSQ